MELETFRWLLTPDGQRLLVRAQEVLTQADGDPLRAADGVRRLAGQAGQGTAAVSADRAAGALTLVRLRERAAAKLGADAERMYFTSEALEQATRTRVAAHRAARVAAADPPSVVDLGCGVGGDLIAFARAGLTAAGVDADPLRAEMAAANLAALGLPGATRAADVTTLDLSPFAVVYADPARRSARGRSFRVEDWAPPWTFVETLLRRAAVVKVAPGIPHDLVPEGVEAEWVSESGEVKEAALWAGPLATARRRATVIGAGGLATLTEAEDPYDGRDRPVRGLGTHLHEPDGAVIRAGLVTALAALVDGGLVDPHIAWVTSESGGSTPYSTTYEVLEELPFHEKPLRAALRARGVGILTIKTRGVDVLPEKLRQRLDLQGDESATLVLTRVAGRGSALLVRRV